MAIYRFKVSFEDFDDITREIDIRSNQTFEDLHHIIHTTTGYNPQQSSSFFVCNDQWIKAEEIAYLPSQRKIDRGVALMNNSRLSSFIDDPHQKFYYTYNFDRPYDFHVELIKILDEEKGKEYPFVVKSTGEAPKPVGTVSASAIIAEPEEDFDFLNDADYAPEHTEELEITDDLAINEHEDNQHGKADDDEEENDDEFLDEFSDNEHYDDHDDYHKEDY